MGGAFGSDTQLDPRGECVECTDEARWCWPTLEALDWRRDRGCAGGPANAEGRLVGTDADASWLDGRFIGCVVAAWAAAA
jgi:hypothetical protein